MKTLLTSYFFVFDPSQRNTVQSVLDVGCILNRSKTPFDVLLFAKPTNSTAVFFICGMNVFL